MILNKEMKNVVLKHITEPVMKDYINHVFDYITQVESDLEILMDAHDYLSCQGTLGSAIYTNICEAGQNEITHRIQYSRQAMKKTQAWKDAEKETDND